MVSKVFDEILAKGVRSGQIPARTQQSRDWFRTAAKKTKVTPDGGFYGINMHYLPHVLRARLMDALYSLSRDKRYDEKTRLKLSYSILNGAAKYKAFKPTFKRYLTNHVRSRFIEITSSEWDIALMMPLQKFAKASASEVWRDSRKTAK